MGEGTTRVVEASEAGARVSELGGEISGVRAQLDALVTELDRRRHAVMSWPRRAAPRRAGGVALAVAAMAAALLFAPRLIPRNWPHRSRRG